MAPQRRKNKEYYAVVSGRIDEPTIFSSWGDAHPRVTGISSVHRSFFTIEEARAYMTENHVTKHKEVIKNGAGETTPLQDSEAFYAVANSKRPGIYRHWYGPLGAKPEVEKFPSACYKRFRTLAQAEAFINDWKESLADVWRIAKREGLDQGLRPCDKKLDVEGKMSRTARKIEDSDMLDEIKLDKLSLEEK